MKTPPFCSRQRRPGAARRGSATVLLLLALAVSLVAVVALKGATDRVVRRKLPGSAIIYIPSGRFLKYATFGYRGLAADMIYLWAIQYYSTPTIDDRFDHLDHIFAIINELDPRYQDPYEVGAMIAVDGAREVLRSEADLSRGRGRAAYAQSLIRAAFAILDRGAANNPDQWVYPFNAGHIALLTLHDYPLAERYFAQCMKIPGAPEFVERLRANAIFKKGDLKTAWETWLDIYRRAPDERTRKIAGNHLYNIKGTIDRTALEEAATKFRERFGRWPADLEALVQKGLLGSVPKDLDGKDYLYDPATGQVRTVISPWRR
jgi:tetratricopeptide (TPR) repeat protein